MNTLYAAIVAAFCAPWAGALAQDQPAEGILDVIDIRPVVARHYDESVGGNVTGLAYNPDADVLYLALADPYMYIYTIDFGGNVLYEVNLQGFYPRGSQIISLEYDETTRRLFVQMAIRRNDVPGYVYSWRVDVLDPATFAPVDNVPGELTHALYVAPDAIWQAVFPQDVLRHHTRDGVFVEDVSVAASFPGYPGPIDLTASFRDGFFVVDHFGERIVEVDAAGRELAAASTASLGNGRGLAIDSDVDSGRIFLVINNADIYVLSPDFIGREQHPVSIEVRPGSPRKTLNIDPQSVSRVAVAILAAGGSGGFDVTIVDPSTVRFGPSDGSASAPPFRHVFCDVDGDGQADLVFVFYIRDTGIACGDTAGVLTGETYSALRIRGADEVVPVDWRARSCLP